MYKTGEVDKVHAVFTNFVKMGVFEPRAVTLYPVDPNLNVYTDTLGQEKDANQQDIQMTNGKQIYTFEPTLEVFDRKNNTKNN